MKIDVNHIAKLANIPLTDEEKPKLEKQLSEVLSYVEQLQKVNTKTVAETSQVTGLENVLREDQSRPSLAQDEALSNAPSQNQGMFQVKGILENQ